jgi:hypothetical protein
MFKEYAAIFCTCNVSTGQKTVVLALKPCALWGNVFGLPIWTGSKSATHTKARRGAQSLTHSCMPSDHAHQSAFGSYSKSVQAYFLILTYFLGSGTCPWVVRWQQPWWFPTINQVSPHPPHRIHCQRPRRVKQRGQGRCLESAASPTGVPQCKPGTPRLAGLGRGYIDRPTTSDSRIDAGSTADERGASPLGIQTSLTAYPIDESSPQA